MLTKLHTAIPALLLMILSSSYGQTQKVYIARDDQMKYSIEKITTTPGAEIELTLKTVSKMQKSLMAHNWVLLKQNVDVQDFIIKCTSPTNRDNEYIDPAEESKIIAYTKLLGDGESDTITFTAPSIKGTYPYICTFPGHYVSGMKSILSVE